jgi:hypothetical protein
MGISPHAYQNGVFLNACFSILIEDNENYETDVREGATSISALDGHILFLAPWIAHIYRVAIRSCRGLPGGNGP